MAAAVKIYEEECAVCTNYFTTPKILPCGHLLCRECVMSWMDSKPNTCCPLCMCPIAESNDYLTRSSNNVADALPTDFVMQAIAVSARMLAKKHSCCACEDVRADFICMQCQDMLCSACTKVHKKLSATRSHDVESLSTVTPERLAASRPALCADHGDKQAEFFCGDHCLAVCSSCRAKKHMECSQVRDLEEEIMSGVNALGNLTKKLATAERSLKQAIDELTVRLQTVEANQQKDITEVDKTCDRLQKLVEDCRRKFKALICSSSEKFRNFLSNAKKELDMRLGKVSSHKHIVELSSAVAPRHALIHATQALTDRVNSLDLTSNLDGDVMANHSPSVINCDDLVSQTEANLQTLVEKLRRMKDSFGQAKGLTDRVNNLNLNDDRGVKMRSSPSASEGRGQDNERLTRTKQQMLEHKQTEPKLAKVQKQQHTIDAEASQISEGESGLTYLRGGYYVSDDFLQPNVLYQLRVDEAKFQALCPSTMQFGVSTRNANFSDIEEGSIFSIAKPFRKDKGVAGLMLDASDKLRFYEDGKETHDILRKCYAVFKFNPSWKVTPLPAKRSMVRKTRTQSQQHVGNQ